MSISTRTGTGLEIRSSKSSVLTGRAAPGWPRSQFTRAWVWVPEPVPFGNSSLLVKLRICIR
jgi:hypothetical protein